MLANDEALLEVAQGPGGLIEALPAGGVHVVMGTHGVATVKALAAAHAKAGQTLVSAPVLGRPEAVTAGRLGIIAAGPPEALAKARRSSTPWAGAPSRPGPSRPRRRR